MATASRSKYGKTLAAVVCDGCETNSPTKHCADCNERFCSTCSKSHLKVKIFKDHVLKNIPSHADNSAEAIEGLAKCQTHKEKTLDIFCKKCNVMICIDCKPDHSSHGLQDLGDDPLIYQRICNKQIQTLLDELHEVEDIKRVLEGQIDSYGEAIAQVDTWETELLAKVKNKASQLRKRLQKLKDERCKNLADKLSNLTVKLKEIDGKYNELNAIRKSIDTEVLSQQLASTQELISNIESYKTEMKPLPKANNVNDILPNADAMKNLDADLGQVFTLESVHDNEAFHYDRAKLLNEIDVKNPVSIYGYNICDHSNIGGLSKITLHGSGTPDIRTLNIVTNTLSKQKSDVAIVDMAAVSDSAYVCTSSDCDRAHLLNNKFKEQFTRLSNTNTWIQSVRCLSPNRFILFERDKSFLSAHLKTMVISENKYTEERKVTVSLGEDPDNCYMAVHNDKETVTLCSDNLLYRVALRDGSSEKHTISFYTNGAVRSCFVDAHDNTLVGDAQGNIHLFDAKYNHQIMNMMKVEGFARDMSIINGRLYITSSTNKVLIYG